jgi:hypothetical protein
VTIVGGLTRPAKAILRVAGVQEVGPGTLWFEVRGSRVLRRIVSRNESPDWRASALGAMEPGGFGTAQGSGGVELRGRLEGREPAARESGPGTWRQRDRIAKSHVGDRCARTHPR